MAKKSPKASEKPQEKSADGKLLDTAKTRYKLCEDWWADNRKAWEADARFRAGDQWPEKIKKRREEGGRPILVVDKLNQYVRQVVNDGRQNRPAIKVRPVEDSDDKVAEAHQGLIRSICDRSNADEAFDTALDHAVGNGYGFFRVLTEYAHKGTFNQEIVIKRVRNPLSVMLDPSFQCADGSDAGFGFVVDEVPKDRFESDYPKATKTDWESDAYSDGWADDKVVRVCEYWHKEEATEPHHLLEDGTTVSDEEYQAALTEGVPAPDIVETREMVVHKVRWCRMTGAEILEQKDWLGEYIPLIPVFGNESDIKGKVTYSGLIRAAKDPQRLYNFSRSAYAERVALSPKAPYVAAAGQIEDYPEWQTANTENHSVLPYNPVDVNGTPLPPPQRQQASDIPEGFARDMQLSEHDIQAAMGMYNASLGEKSNEKSGRAIMARQREGDNATFHFPDNLSRALRYLGRILVDLAPKVYDSRRVLRLLGEDGTSSAIVVDPSAPQPYQKNTNETIYNLGSGKFDVSVSSGPSYTTKRQEAAEAMIQLTQANPALLQIAGDIMVKNMDWLGADEVAERMRIMLPPQIQQSLNEDIPPEAQAIVSQMGQQLQQLQQQIQMAEQGIAERDQALQQTQQENQALKASREAEMAKVEVDRYRADTERMKAEAEAQRVEPDNTPLEAMKLEAEQTAEQIRNEYEDRWKNLDSETKIIVAEIAAHKAQQIASVNAQARAKAPQKEVRDGH